MEYIDGDTLSNLRAASRTGLEPQYLNNEQPARDALDYAHNHARIIHRT